MAPDVVLVADGGGLAPAVAHPIEGRAGGGVPRPPLAGGAGRGGHHAADQRRGRGPDRPGRRVQPALTFVVEDGRIARIYVMRNPHKLGRLEEVAELRR